MNRHVNVGLETLNSDGSVLIGCTTCCFSFTLHVAFGFKDVRGECCKRDTDVCVFVSYSSVLQLYGYQICD